MRFILISMSLSLFACGGSSASTSDDVESRATSGGEDRAARPAPPIRTTIPVPVPQPAVAREELSGALQALWTHVEETVAIRPPDGPEAGTEEQVNEWAQGPFVEWIGDRRERMRAAIASSEDVPEDPAHSRAVAAGLLAYALEDFVAGVRGAPVPDSVARDPELLAAYVAGLDEQIGPLATEAVLHYAYCQRRFAALGDESEWLPWRAYCVQRGQEMIDVYGLSPPSEDEPPVEASPEAEPTS